MTTATATQSTRTRNPWIVVVVMTLGLFMTLLDLTIVNIAIPSIVTGLNAGLDQVLWMLNGYSLCYAVLLITSGRLGDVVGQRNLFVSGVFLFTAASAFSGLSQSPGQLIAGRALQGVVRRCWRRRRCRCSCGSSHSRSARRCSRCSASWLGWPWSPDPRSAACW